VRLIVIAGMIDAKLTSKIAPILAINEISEVHLSRRQPYKNKKIICHSPPRIFNKLMPLTESWRILNLFYLCLRFRPKLIIAFGTVPHGVYAWILGKMLRIPVIQHVMGKNDLRLTFKKSIGKRITLRAVKAGDAIGVRGQATIEYLINKGISANKLFKPQNLHNFKLFKPDPCVNKTYDLIYVGLLSSYKRLDLLIDSFHQAKQSLAAITLLIVGDGPLRESLQKQLERLDLTNSVHFVGLIEFNQLPAYFQQAKAFIMTSQGEGLPMSMIEALSCGLPVIMPRDADITDVAKNNYNALIVSEWKIKAFSEAIIKMLSDQSLYNKLHAGALTLFQDKTHEYSIEYQARLWSEVFATVLKSR